MGLLDKLFGKKTIPAELLTDDSDMENTGSGNVSSPQSTGTYAETANGQLPTKEEFTELFRKSFSQFFPENLDTVQNHMQLPLMTASAFDITPVLVYARDKVYSRFDSEPEKLSELGNAAIAKVAIELEKYFGTLSADTVESAVMYAQGEGLGKAWYVLDYYRRMLKAEYTQNIISVHNIITNELIERSVPGADYFSESYGEILEKCSGCTDAEMLPALRKRLFAKLMSFDKIYVLSDGNFNSNFPYIGADGKAEIQTNAERANALKEFLEKSTGLKVGISEYSKNEYMKLFKKLCHNGLSAIRLDNGLSPVELDISEHIITGEVNLLERCNRYARGMFIRSMQYLSRLKEIPEAEKDSEGAKLLIKSRTGASICGYRALAGGLVYVLAKGIQNDGQTLYTPKALETAREIMKSSGITDENTLVSVGDSGYDVYDGALTIRTASKKTQDSEKTYVFAFTEKECMQTVRDRFAKGGVEDGIIIMSFQELLKSCTGYDGFILDMGLYSYEVPAESFGKIVEKVREEGIIVNGKAIGA